MKGFTLVAIFCGVAAGGLLSPSLGSAVLYQPAMNRCSLDNNWTDTGSVAIGVFNYDTSLNDNVDCMSVDDTYSTFDGDFEIRARVWDRNDSDDMNCRVIVFDRDSNASVYAGSYVSSGVSAWSTTTPYYLAIDFPSATSISVSSAMNVLSCDTPEVDSGGASGVAHFYVYDNGPG